MAGRDNALKDPLGAYDSDSSLELEDLSRDLHVPEPAVPQSKTAEMEASDRAAKRRAAGTTKIAGIQPGHHKVKSVEPEGLSNSLSHTGTFDASVVPAVRRHTTGGVQRTAHGLGRARRSWVGGGASNNRPISPTSDYGARRHSLGSSVPKLRSRASGYAPALPGAFSVPHEPTLQVKSSKGLSRATAADAPIKAPGATAVPLPATSFSKSKGLARPAHNQSKQLTNSMNHSGKPKYYGNPSNDICLIGSVSTMENSFDGHDSIISNNGHDSNISNNGHDSIISIPGAHAVGAGAARNEKRRRKFVIQANDTGEDSPTRPTVLEGPGLSGAGHTDLRWRKFHLANPGAAADADAANTGKVYVESHPTVDVETEEDTPVAPPKPFIGGVAPPKTALPPVAPALESPGFCVAPSGHPSHIPSLAAPVHASSAFEEANSGAFADDPEATAMDALGRDAGTKKLPVLSQKNKRVGLGICATTLAVVVIIVVAVVLSGSSGDGDGDEKVLNIFVASTTSAPGEVLPRPDNVDMEAFLLSILPSVTMRAIVGGDGVAMNDVALPPLASWDWILKDPMLRHYSSIRLLQRFSLATLYHATNGVEWTNVEAWLSFDHHECNWSTGITCDGPTDNSNYADGTVTELKLLRNNLKGSLPREISLLSNVKGIILSLNRLRGSVPPEIRELTLLRELVFDDNEISVSLPSEIGLLTDIMRISAKRNILTGPLPSEMGKLSVLKELVLTDNQISSSLPMEFANMVELNQLYLEGNRLIGAIPKGIGNLSKLKDLYLNHNQLSSSIPTGIGGLISVTRVELGSNSLTGRLPTEVGLLSNVVFFSIEANNMVGGLPTELGLMGGTGLQKLALHSNFFSGPIPKTLSNLLSLKTLQMHNNTLTSSIPLELPMTLEELSLDVNHMTGTIHTEIALLTDLVDFWASRNSFTGTIPTELGLLTHLKELILDRNPLMGTVPTELSALTALWHINVTHTQLSGEFPATFCDIIVWDFDCGSMCGCNCTCPSAKLQFNVGGEKLP